MMKKPLSFTQRLALQVHCASTMTKGTSFPHGFEAYAKAAASCQGRKLVGNTLPLLGIGDKIN